MLRIGTRGSQLALWQARFIKSEINSLFPDIQIKIEVIKTEGDKLVNSPLSEIGGKGVFVKDIEEALLNNKIDLAVHSLKDMTSVLPGGLIISAVTKRKHAADALVSRNNIQLEELKPGSRVGTGSLRRKAQLLYHYPWLEIVPIRGNVETRLVKLDSENLDAIILAVAGLQRMGFGDRISQIIDTEILIPAPGQGIVAVESREEDENTNNILSGLSDLNSKYESLLERSFLKSLGGDCNIPAGCYAKVEGKSISSIAFISDESGNNMFTEKIIGKVSESENLGATLFNMLIENGASGLVKDIS
ncbi:MAG: hydroxymethylbilane synthase [Thermodesulfobacteriota bacterium]